MFQIRLLIISTILTGLGIATAVVAGNSEFENWMKQETQSYQEYRDKRDKEFTGFLKSQWKEMQVFQGLERDKTPKPVSMPVAPKPFVEKPVPQIKSKQPVVDAKPGKTLDKKPVIVQVSPKPVLAPVIVKIPVIKPAPKPVLI